MKQENKTVNDLEKEIAELRGQLDEANDTIEAIRTGKVDALIVHSTNGHQLYTLKSADQTYRVFIEKMKEGAVTLNRDGIIIYSNSRFASMLNMPLAEVIGIQFENFISSKDKKKFETLLNQGWLTESKGEIFLLNYEKNAVPFLLSLTTLELDEGLALSIIVTDLSLQKETERQLKIKHEELLQAHSSLAKLNNELEFRVAERTLELSLSREHFKFLADNIPVIVWTAGGNGDVEYFNKRWYEYTGTTFEESKKWGWQKVIHPDDLPGTMEAWKGALATGNNYYTEYRFLRAVDKLYRWHSGTAIPYKNKDGKIIQWFGICTDIEDQRLAMEKKDEFISMASHELKTPITTLKAFTQMLLITLEKENNSKAADFLSGMNKQINKLTGLITDLLDATKVNAGVMYFEQEHFDFNELVIEIANQMQLTSPKHIIETNLYGSPFIYADRNRLGQVITNLISNAIKYSPDANKIIVSVEGKNNSLQLSVKDYGIGIPKEQQPKLFSRFFRAGDVKTNSFPGLGLGLYISNEIIKRHSGTLTFESEEGKGSVFSIELPLHRE